MNSTEPLNSTELIQATKERGLYYLRSTIKCVICKTIFPIEYDDCPQCELDELYSTFNIQYKKSIGGKQN